MEGLCRSFDELCAESATFKMLLTLARSSEPYIPTAAATRAAFAKSAKEMPASERPAWMAHLDTDKDFYAIFKDLKLDETERRQCYLAVYQWLRSVLYQTCMFIPNISEDTAHNVALGHPIAVWLYEYVDLLEASCAVAMACWQSLNAKDDTVPPPALIRLPQLTIKFRVILLPVVNLFLKDSWKGLKEVRSKYCDK